MPKLSGRLDYDVLIVGAGPAGTLAARNMAKSGLRVKVIDALSAPKRKICGEYLCPKGVELLREEGLAQELEPLFRKLVGMEIFAPSGRQVSTRFPGHQDGAYGWALNRGIFDVKLIEAARASGAEIQFGEVFENFESLNGYVRVKTNKDTYLVRLLVGADGRKSRVAQAMGVELHAPTKRVAIHAYLPTADRTGSAGEMHLFKDGSYIGIDPTANNELNVSLVVDGNRVRELGGMRETFQHYISESKDLKNRFGVISPETELWAVSPIHHQVKASTAGSVALIGDAAGFIDPLTGEGIFNAMLSGKVLAEEISRASVLLPLEVRAALQRYQERHTMVLMTKSRLNRMFQDVIRRPKLMDGIASFLLLRKKHADAFVGIIGNIYSPFQGVWKMML